MTNDDDLVQLDGETLAYLAIGQIVRDAKQAMQPHIDNLTRLKAMQAPGALLVRDPDKGEAPSDDRTKLINDLTAAEHKYRNAVEGEYMAELLKRARLALTEGMTL